jgi:hypothetical protein
MFSSTRILFFAASLAATGSSAMAIVARPPAGTPPFDRATTITPAGDSVPFMAFGAAAVAIMALCRTQERRLPWLSVGTFVAGMLAALYGFGIGAWPLGLAISGYAIACHCKWLAARGRPTEPPRSEIQKQTNLAWWSESRMTRMFGPMA